MKKREEMQGHFSQSRPVGVGSGMPFETAPDIHLIFERTTARTKTCMDKLSAATTVLEFMQSLHTSLNGITYGPSNTDGFVLLDHQKINALVEKLPSPTEEEKPKVDELVNKINGLFNQGSILEGLDRVTYKLEHLISHVINSSIKY